MIYSPDFFEDRAAPTEDVVVHELAHQWVGDSLSVAAWKDIWLNEGFATYTEWLWDEHESRATADETFENFAGIPPHDPFWSLPIGDPGPKHLFDYPVYARGAMTLHALRTKIGDTAFFHLLHEWVDRHADGNVTTPEFIALAEEVSGQPLEGFFHKWLFTAERPHGLGFDRWRLSIRLFEDSGCRHVGLHTLAGIAHLGWSALVVANGGTKCLVGRMTS